MDLSTLIGILTGIVLLGGAIIMGGNAVIFLSVQSLMIVLGGTLAGTMVSYSFNELKKIPSLIRVAFQEHTLDSDEIIDILVGFC